MRLTNRLLLLAIPALLLSACVDNRVSVQAKHICAPPDADNCEFGGKCDAVTLSPFFFDLFATSPRMWLFVEFENQLPDNGDPDVGRVDSNDAYVQQIDISYEGGGLGLADASYRMEQMVDSGGTQVLSIYPLPDSAVTELRTMTIGAGVIVDVVAKVRAKGLYAGGQSFETGDLEIPLRICRGCLNPTAVAYACDPGDLLAACPPGSAPGGFLAQTPASLKCVSP